MAVLPTPVKAAGHYKDKNFVMRDIQFIHGEATIVAGAEKTQSLLSVFATYGIWPVSVAVLKQAEIDNCLEEVTSANKVSILSEQLAKAKLELASAVAISEEKLQAAKVQAAAEHKSQLANQENAAAQEMKAEIARLNALQEEVRLDGEAKLAAQKADAQKELEQLKKEQANGTVPSGESTKNSGDTAKASPKNNSQKS